MEETVKYGVKTVASETISYRCSAEAATTSPLCGGRAAGTKMIRSSPKAQ